MKPTRARRMFMLSPRTNCTSKSFAEIRVNLVFADLQPRVLDRGPRLSALPAKPTQTDSLTAGSGATDLDVRVKLSHTTWLAATDEGLSQAHRSDTHRESHLVLRTVGNGSSQVVSRQDQRQPAKRNLLSGPHRRRRSTPARNP